MKYVTIFILLTICFHKLCCDGKFLSLPPIVAESRQSPGRKNLSSEKKIENAEKKVIFTVYDFSCNACDMLYYIYLSCQFRRLSELYLSIIMYRFVDRKIISNTLKVLHIKGYCFLFNNISNSK